MSEGLAPASRQVAEPRPFLDQVEAVRQGSTSLIRTVVPVEAEEWDALRGLVGLTELIVEEGVADDAMAGIVATLPDLERIVLRKSPLTDEGFRRLADCRQLRDLNIPGAACSAEGVRSLTGLATLRALRLGGDGLVGHEVCEAIVAIGSLRSLHLIDVPIGDRGLDVLGTLPDLRNLYLDGAGVSDGAWRRYFDGHPDVHVHIDQSHHDRDPRADSH